MRSRPEVVAQDVPVKVWDIDKLTLAAEIRAKLRYDRNDPLAVNMDFYDEDDPEHVEPWCFARELLVLGHRSFAGVGEGDVHIWRLGHWYNPEMGIKLTDATGGAMRATMPWRPIQRFVKKMNLVVPFADTHLDVNVDRELGLLLQGGHA